MKICYCVNCFCVNNWKYYCKEECYQIHEKEPKERKCPSCNTLQLLNRNCDECWSYIKICTNCCIKCTERCCYNEGTNFCNFHYNKKHKSIIKN